MISAMSHQTELILVSIFGVIFLILYSIFTKRDGQTAVRNWAKENNYTILKLKQPLIVPTWKSRKGCSFFEVTLKNSDGIEKQCLIQIDFWGNRSTRFKVTWDET